MIFEVPINFSSSPRLLIIRNGFLSIYLSVLIMLPEKSSIVSAHCSNFYAIVKDSYWNYMFLRKVITSNKHRMRYSRS